MENQTNHADVTANEADSTIANEGSNAHPVHDSNIPLSGSIDAVEAGVVHGWAAYQGDNKPVSIHVIYDGKTIGTGVADTYREDLKTAGINDGKHGFAIEIDDILKREEIIKLVVCDSSASQNTVEKELLVERKLIGNIDEVERGYIYGWASDDNFNKSLVVEAIYKDEVVAEGTASNFRADLQEKFSFGALGFKLKVDQETTPNNIGHSKLWIREKGTKQVIKGATYSKCSASELIDGTPFFNESYYNKEYKGCWGWKHYCEYGAFENKKPSKNIVAETLDLNFKKDEASVPLIEMIRFAKSYKCEETEEKPKLSIIILNWNKSLMTLQCVYTIFKNTHHKSIEIIVVDNGSRDEEFSLLMLLKMYSSVKIIRNKTNRYYGEANNIGVEHSSSENICLLNNDAFVGLNWDKYLLDELESDDSIGGVGPKFLFPNGVLQEAGGELNPCGQNVQIGKGLDPKLSFFNRKADVSHVSAACFILKRSLYDRVNGFDYRYEPAYFEDADLTAKIASLGYRVRYVPQAEVVHVENATSKDPDIGFNFGSLIGTNRIKFVEKWGDYFRGGKSPKIPDFTEAYKLQDEGEINGKVAVIYSPYNLTPGGGERYVLSLAIAAQESGYKTYFCAPEKYSKYRFHTVADELALDVSGIYLMSQDELDERDDIALFVVMGNELSPALKGKGREKNIYHCQFPFPMSDWHLTNCLNNVIDYDVVIVNSEFTKQAYENEGKKYYLDIPPVEVVSPPVDMIERKEKPNDGVVRVLNVGRFISGGHCKKQVELVQAFNILTKELSERSVETKMTLIGSLGPNQEDREYLEKIKSIAGTNVEIILNASRETIIDHYQKSDFYWHGTGINEDVNNNPQVFEHFGITPVEAMSAGCKPVVWHEGGPKEVLHSLGVSSLHTATALNDYAFHTLLLAEDKKEFMVSAGVFSNASFRKKLKSIIDEA